MSLLRVDRATHWFRTQTKPALDNVSFEIAPGETIALVGESGCGKSTLGRVSCGMLTPTAGSVMFDGQAVDTMSKRQIKQFRMHAQMVHQDPFASLNPGLPLRTTLGYPLRYHRLVRNRDLQAHLMELLKSVGLDEDSAFLDRYPHQLSGGQRQRVSIARALSLNPSLIVADEAVSMLDVSMRVSLLDLMLRLQDERGMAFLFVSHDLGVVRYFAGEGRIMVMFYGLVVEEGRTEDVITNPRHPYTTVLLAGTPVPDPRRARQRARGASLKQAEGTASDAGCVFYQRCPLAQRRCLEDQPPLLDVGSEHRTACWFHESVPPLNTATIAVPTSAEAN